MNAGGHPAVVADAALVKVVHPAGFEVGEVGSVVNDAHQIGLEEADAERMTALGGTFCKHGAFV